jgi:hypothetical protein
LSGVIRYLKANWPLMARSAADGGHPAVDEWYADVRAIRGRAWAALRLIPSDLDHDLEPPADYVLECPTDDCHNRIPMTRLPRPIDGEKPEPVSVSCNRCGARWTTPRLLLVAAVSGTRVEITVEDAANHYGVTMRTVRRMVERGELHRGRRGYVVVGGQEATG